jgi:hypothetical protein
MTINLWKTGRGPTPEMAYITNTLQIEHIYRTNTISTRNYTDTERATSTVY